MLKVNSIYNADCRNLMNDIDDKSIDMICCDLPYGETNNEEDVIIPFDELWKHYKRIIKDNGAIVLTASGMFTADLMKSNPKMWKYNLVWEKSKATGYLNAKKQPMRAHEDILVFYNKQCTYNPQMTQGEPYNKGCAVRDTFAYAKQEKAVLVKNDTGLRYPRSVQYFVTAESEGKLHPTQKPVKLIEYLIKTYSNENDLILDNCSGSGTTAIACYNTRRNFICIEKDKDYYEKSVERLEIARSQLRLF